MIDQIGQAIGITHLLRAIAGRAGLLATLLVGGGFRAAHGKRIGPALEDVGYWTSRNTSGVGSCAVTPRIDETQTSDECDGEQSQSNTPPGMSFFHTVQIVSNLSVCTT